MLATFEEADAVAGLQRVEDAAVENDLVLAKELLTTHRIAIENLITRITESVS